MGDARQGDARNIGVALSGGGHRATAFGLGALQALADNELNRHVASISSVSGGSIANGIAMVGPDYGTADAAAFEAHISGALNGIANRGVLLDHAPRTKGFIRALVLSLVAFGVGLLATLGLAIGHVWLGVAIAAVVTIVTGAVAWSLFRQRSIRTEDAIDAELLGGQKSTLDEFATRSVHHVICTTELQTGVSFYFTNRGVYGYGFGGTKAAPKLPLATAVQASACVPGAFAPRVIKTETVGLTTLVTVAGTPPKPDNIVLVDGGVYDNMADEWEYGYFGRAKLWAGLRTMQPDAASMLVIVNGSAGWNSLQPVKGGGFAVEKAGLMRSQGVQYDVSTAHRRRALYDRFVAHGNDANDDVHGVFVQISDSPYAFANKFRTKPGQPEDEKAARAAKAIAALNDAGYTEAFWQQMATRNSRTPTTLAKLDVNRTVELFEHGYVLTAVNLYVQHGLGTVTGFDRARFRRTVVGQ
jgi:predicted acylesterase/phospholipase RssA